jgi:hypothetical protein
MPKEKKWSVKVSSIYHKWVNENPGHRDRERKFRQKECFSVFAIPFSLRIFWDNIALDMRNNAYKADSKRFLKTRCCNPSTSEMSQAERADSPYKLCKASNLSKRWSQTVSNVTAS